MTTEKKVFGQMDETGAIHVAFVGTEEELQAQIDKDYADEVAKIQETIGKYEAELEKVKGTDLAHSTEENIENAAKYVHYTKMLFGIKHQLAEFKKPTIADGTYFVLPFIGKLPELAEK